LLRPGSLAAVAGLALNDHVLKGAGLLPGWITGKLSDVAGLYLFPLVLAALADTAARVLHRTFSQRHLAGLASGATALVFGAVKLWPAANAALARVIGPIALDPTDLLALPMAFLAARVLTATSPPSPSVTRPSLAARARPFATLGLACVACAATTRLPPNYPRWETVGARERRIGCANVDAWVSKSGKEGFGVTVDVRSAEEGCPCHVELAAAAFRDAGGAVTNAPLPAPLDAGSARVHAYLPFAFDNQAVWNASLANPAYRRGTLVLGIKVGPGQPETVTIPLRQPDREEYGHWPEPRHPPESSGRRDANGRTPAPEAVPSPPDVSPRYGGTCWPD